MGCFSWLDCQTKKSIKIGDKCYLLIPKEFGGGYIEETWYDGYGNFGYEDVFVEVFKWNSAFDNTKCIEQPVIDNYGGLYSFEKEQLLKDGVSEEEVAALDLKRKTEFYERALGHYNFILKCIDLYKNQGELALSSFCKEKNLSFSDIIRELGIAISCEDWQNKLLTYPIKISKKPAVYEECSYSLGDPSQGCC